MQRYIVSVGLLISAAGCNGDAARQPEDAAAVYEAVLKEELKGAKKGGGFYVSVDGKDPAPELLKRFQKHWPELQPGSKVPEGKGNGVSVGGLKWIDGDTADLEGGFSNGMDGRGSRYRVVRKRGEWVVESVVVERES